MAPSTLTILVFVLKLVKGEAVSRKRIFPHEWHHKSLADSTNNNEVEFPKESPETKNSNKRKIHGAYAQTQNTKRKLTLLKTYFIGIN